MNVNPEVVGAWAKHLTHKYESRPFGNAEENEESKTVKLPQGKNWKDAV